MNGIFIQSEPTTGVGWTVSRGGQQGTTQWVKTQSDAVRLARSIAERTGLPIWLELAQ